MIRAVLARPDDLPSVVDITQRAFAAWEPIIGAVPVPVTEDYAPRIAKAQVWIIERDEARQGVMVVEAEPEALLLFSLVVLPEAQGQGLGRWMLRHAETLARHSSRARLRLFTNVRMERNIALYRSWGFRDVGERDLGRVRVLDMEKWLVPPTVH